MNAVAGSTAIDPYCYSALPDPANQIRLLEIEDDDTNDAAHVRCKLTAWSTDSCPSYHAISYTWGDPDPTDSILVDGKTRRVTRNCATVLRQMRYFKTSKYYWLDALCIDQGNNVEKSHQVGRIGDVFERAEHVFACLGADDEGCEYAMRMMVETQTVIMPPNESFMLNHEHKSHITALNSRLLEHVPGIDLARFFLGVVKLAESPFFFRVWILQEMFLARDVSLVFGHHRLPRLIFYWQLNHAKFVMEYPTKYMTALLQLPEPYRARPGFTQTSIETMEAFMSTRKYVRAPFAETLNLMSMTAGSSCSSWVGRNLIVKTNVIEICRHRECWDRRDTIFGTLALTKWNNSKPVVPDYSKTTFDVALDYLDNEMNYMTMMDLLKILDIDQDHPRMEAGIEARKRRAFDCVERSGLLRTLTVNDHTLDQLYTINNKIVQQVYGRQIVSVRTEQDVRNETGQMKWQTWEDLIILSESILRADDWVVKSEEELSRFGDINNYLILRPVGLRFATIGRAWKRRPRGPQFFKVSTKFNVYFDREDLLILAHSLMKHVEGLRSWGQQSEAYFNFSICRTEFSSYAVGAGARTDSLREYAP